MAFKISLKLTSYGQARLNTIAKSTESFTRDFLRQGVEKIVRPAVQKRAPTPGIDGEEARITSLGIDEIGEVVGTPKGGRFLKRAGGFKWIQEAIGEERARTHQEGTIWFADFGIPARINPKIGFAWQSRTLPDLKTKIRTTRDGGELWGRLIQAWEYGGSYGAATVTPREGKAWLSPEPGMYRRQVTKFIGTPPWQMFKKGYEDSKEKLAANLKKQVKKQVRSAFGG